MGVLIMILLFVTSVFLVLLVLIQRGRGGGLAGAFGGMGGQSAFGTKAGDVFTRVTIGTAAVWILLCAFAVKWYNEGGRGMIDTSLGGARSSSPVSGGAPKDDGKPGATGGATPSAPESAPASAPASTPASEPGDSK